MSAPTADNPKIKYVNKSRKGIPIKMWCKSYYEADGMGKLIFKQDWSEEKPK